MRKQLHKLTEELRNLKDAGKTEVAAEVLKKILESMQLGQTDSTSSSDSRYGKKSFPKTDQRYESSMQCTLGAGSNIPIWAFQYMPGHILVQFLTASCLL